MLRSRWISGALLMGAGIALGGCIGPPSKDQVLPEDGPTTEEILDRELGASGGSGSTATDARARREEGKGGYTRAAMEGLDARFRRVENPTYIMYVRPHLAGDAPIPGYVTRFRQYTRDHYALPGEAVE